MILPEHAESVKALKQVLEQRILGTQVPEMSCDCGCITLHEAIATEVRPGEYEGQKVPLLLPWILWIVKMTPVDPAHAAWSTGLSEFIPLEELEELFRQHFGDDGRNK